MPSFDTKHLHAEFSRLTFAKVSKLVMKEEHLVDKDSLDPVYSHFFGFAYTEKKEDDPSKSVWFKKASHLSEMHKSLSIGSATHAPTCEKLSEYPKRGELVVGEIKETTKGFYYVWWTHNVTCFLNFRMFMHSPRKLNNQQRAFAMLQLKHSATNAPDDLYVMAQVIFRKDVSLLVSQLMVEEKRPRHPWLKDASGYQRKRGYTLQFHPVQVAYFISLLCKNEAIYEAFVQELHKKEATVFEWPHDLLKEYSKERLQVNIQR